MVSTAVTTTARRPALSEELQAQRDAFYAELPEYEMGALWNVLGNALTKEPRTKSVPHLWKWADVRPRVLRSGELVTAEEAERRVLMLLNPGLPPEKMVAVGTLYAGVQLILPGEIARTHHHTPSATRFIIEGELAYSTVSGERTLMRKGDYVTTPNWTWHDHGNESSTPMLWLDGLDIPLVTELDAVFFEEWEHGEEIQPVTKPSEDAAHRWGSNLRPTYQRPEGAHSPVLNYRWENCRAALHATARTATPRRRRARPLPARSPSACSLRRWFAARRRLVRIARHPAEGEAARRRGGRGRALSRRSRPASRARRAGPRSRSPAPR